MKRNLSRLGAVLLCIALCLCGTLSVFAADETTAPETTAPTTPVEPTAPAVQWDTFANVIGNSGVINVTTTDVEGATHGALTATLYKLIDVSNDDANLPAQPLYKWNSAVAKWVADNYPDYVEWTGEGETKVATDVVSEAYLNLVSDNDGLPKTEAINAFAGKISAAIRNNEITPAPTANTQTLTTSGETESTTRTGSFTNLDAGSYLVIIGGGNLVYRPTMANLTPEWLEAGEAGEGKDAGWYVKTPQELNIKASPVTITKEVSDPSAAIGDTVTFTIDATVPQYPANVKNTKFVIGDTLSKGLLLVDGSVKVYGVTGTGETAVEAELVNSETTTYYTFNYTSAADTDTANSGSFTVDLAYDNVAEYTSIKVVYNTTITKDAVVGVAGNPNKATITYSNAPYDTDTFTTKTTETKVYTYGLDLTKVDQAKHEITLSGAEFEVIKVGAAEADNVKMTFVKDGDGVYHVASAEEKADETVAKTTAVITGEGGKLDIRGLDVGTYNLKETKAPAGYVLLSGVATFTITDDKNAEGNDGADGIADDVAAVEDKRGYVGTTVENRTGFNLPLTGGMGTALFTVGGVVLVALAAVLLFVANRKKSGNA